MCGRFVLLADLSMIMEEFDIQEVDRPLLTGGDIHPGRQVSAIVHRNGNRLAAFHWGLVPSWAKDPAIGRKMINARAETVTAKPSFKNAFAKRRCLIIADGFYEWQKTGTTGNKPWLFRLKNGKPFGFAGLYETWASPGKQEIASCTIITTIPNELVAPIHNRMPVIVPKEREAAWLDPGNHDRTGLLSLLAPYPSAAMERLPATGRNPAPGFMNPPADPAVPAATG